MKTPEQEFVDELYAEMDEKRKGALIGCGIAMVGLVLVLLWIVLTLVL